MLLGSLTEYHRIINEQQVSNLSLISTPSPYPTAW